MPSAKQHLLHRPFDHSFARNRYRIDILADGALAIYGSYAIAGVINIVLKRGYDGAVTQRHFSAPDAATITSRR